MLNKKVLQKINKEELANNIIDLALNFRDSEGIVYAEIGQNNEINVDFKHGSNYSTENWIAWLTTENMEEYLPPDLPDEIKNAKDDVEAYFRTYAKDLLDLGIIESIF